MNVRVKGRSQNVEIVVRKVPVLDLDYMERVTPGIKAFLNRSTMPDVAPPEGFESAGEVNHE